MDKKTKKLVPICTDTGHDARKAYTVSVQVKLSWLQKTMASMFSSSTTSRWNGDETMRVPLAHARDHLDLNHNDSKGEQQLLYESVVLKNG